MTESVEVGRRVRLPNGAGRPIQVFINGTEQREGADYSVHGREIVFSRPLVKEKVSRARWLAMTPRPLRQLRQERGGRCALPRRRQDPGDHRREGRGLMRVCLMIEGQESVTWEEWLALAEGVRGEPDRRALPLRPLPVGDRPEPIGVPWTPGRRSPGWRRSRRTSAWERWSRRPPSGIRRCWRRTSSRPITSRAAAGSSSAWATAGSRPSMPPTASRSRRWESDSSCSRSRSRSSGASGMRVRSTSRVSTTGSAATHCPSRSPLRT